MVEPIKLTRIPSLKTVAEFRAHVASLGIDLPCEDAIATGSASPLAQALRHVAVNGKYIGNRYTVHPMEGWDGTTGGGITEEVVRRWQRFGESGAKLIFGGEAMAVRPDGRANPNQLIINEQNKADLARLRESLVAAHKERCGTADDLVIGFQLTHSGRFCKPNDKFRLEPRVAYRHPILDRTFKVTSDTQVWTDSELERLVEDYARAAKIAWDVGADFVDIKHCHGYLLHEFLSAFTRPGKYGGSFENRTRLLRDIVAAIRASEARLDFGVRLSAFDFVPFKPDPASSRPGKPGPGMPEDFSRCLPYRYAFGVNQDNPVAYDLAETVQFLELCAQLGVKIVNLSAGSPYLQSAYPAARGLSAIGWLPAARRPARRGGPADQCCAPAQGPRAEEPFAGRHRLQLFAGILAARGPIRPAQRLGRQHWHRAHGALVSADTRRCDGAGDPLRQIHLPHLQRLHHGPAQRPDQRLLSPGPLLRREIRVPETQGVQESPAAVV